METTATANKVLPKAGLNGFDLAFVQGSTAVILLNYRTKLMICVSTALQWQSPEELLAYIDKVNSAKIKAKAIDEL